MSNKKIKNSAFAKAIATFTGFAMVVMMLGGAAVAPAQAATVDELAAQISSLLATIAGLQAQLAGMTGGGTGVAVACSFTRGLYPEMSGADVKCLQQYLNASGNTVAASGVGSSGNETEYYGSLTKAAVAMWQAANGVAVGAWAGYFGPASQATYNALAAAGGGTTGGGTTGGGTTGTGVTVSAGTQPAATLAPYDAARVPFTNITLTNNGAADATINGVTVERTGLAVDGNFAGVVLLDGDGAQLGIAKTLNSNHQATIGGTFTIPVGQSRTYTVAGNMAAVGTVKAGEVASFAVVAINTGATVSGSLPITGAAHTINATLATGTVTAQRGPLDPNGAQTKEVGTTGYTFSSVKITAGSQEKVRLNSIRWNQASSSADSDLANLVTIVDGTSYPATVSSDGKYYTSKFGSGIVMDKGNSVEVSIKGDIVSGSGRTIAFNIEKKTDVNLTGELYGYGITPPTTGTGITSGNIWYAASTVTVSTGSLSVTKATSVGAQNVAINLSDQVLGGFDVEVKGEDISVASIVFNVNASAVAVNGSDLTNVSLVDANGTVVAGPVDGVAANTVTFSDTIIFPIGKNTYTLKGKLSTDFSSDETVSASTTPSTDWTTVTGQVTGKTITPSSSVVTGNTMTVKGAVVTISVANTPAAQTVVAGAQSFVFANYKLDATASGEDIKFSSIPLEYNIGNGTATNVSGCALYDGSTATQTGTNTVDPSAAGSSTTFTFDGVGFTVPKGTVKTLSLKCNIAAGATGNYEWGYDSGSSPSATGLVSGQSATITENDSEGQLMTLATGGTLTVSKDTSSPSYALASAGTSNVVLGVLKFEATNEQVNLERVALVMTGTASSSPSDVTRVTLWDGSTQVGEAEFVGSSIVATSTLTSSFAIPKDGTKLMTIKGDLASIGTSQIGTQGALIKVDYDASATIGTQGKGASSGTTINQSSSSDTAMDGVRVFRSFPTVAKLSVPTNTLSNGDATLLRFSVTADSAGDIGLSKFTIRLSTTTAAVTALNIYAFTDSGFSTAMSGLSSGGAILANNKDLGATLKNWVSSATDLNFFPETSASASTTIQVPAGETRYFEVIGTVSGAASGADVRTQLQGDAKYFEVGDLDGAGLAYGKASTTANVEADAGSNNDFIWSGNATTSSTILHQDWTNGYGVSGLPSLNLSAEVLSK